jgi:hypothetical protein
MNQMVSVSVTENFKGIATLIAKSEKRVLIDSFCQTTYRSRPR